MAGVLDDVNRRTQLAGNNRMELLLFRLAGTQRYGINVFKVKEVIICPTLTHIPHSHPVVRGVATIRGVTFPVMDLGAAVGMPPVDDPRACYVIVAEYNRRVQGFLVHAVERIVNMKWDDVQPPPKVARASYLTAITRVDDELVEIIDVEKVLVEVTGLGLAASTKEPMTKLDTGGGFILVADDSTVARTQIKRLLDDIGVPVEIATNGKEALSMLRGWASNEPERFKQLIMVISDIEMPEMDGYTLCTEVRRDPRLAKLYIMLHTSLSGVFNNALVEQVGADKFISKFKAEELGCAVSEYITSLQKT